MARIRMICNRCGAICEGAGRSRNEATLKAEQQYDRHTCRHADGRPMRRLDELSLDLLHALARREITEVEAWERHDAEVAHATNA